MVLKLTTDWERGLTYTMTVYHPDVIEGSSRIPIRVTKTHRGKPPKEAAIFLLTRKQAEALVAEIILHLKELKDETK